MKKVTCILLAALILLSMAGCGNSAPQETTGTTTAVKSTVPETFPKPSTTPEATAPEITSAEILEQAKALYLQMHNTQAQGDYAAFANCFAITDDAEIQLWFKQMENVQQFDQHHAVYVLQQDEYHLITFVDAIVAGTHPNTQRSSTCSNHVFVMTDDGCKIVGNSEVLNSIDISPVLPDEVAEIAKTATNLVQFNTTGYAYLDQNFYFEGSLEFNSVFAYQDADGKVYLYLLISNGTDGNRSIYNLHVEVTDSVLGTILSETHSGSVIVKKNSSKLIVLEYPAECIKTGTATWGNINVSTNCKYK